MPGYHPSMASKRGTQATQRVTNARNRFKRLKWTGLDRFRSQTNAYRSPANSLPCTEYSMAWREGASHYRLRYAKSVRCCRSSTPGPVPGNDRYTRNTFENSTNVVAPPGQCNSAARPRCPIDEWMQEKTWTNKGLPRPPFQSRRHPVECSDRERWSAREGQATLMSTGRAIILPRILTGQI